MRYFLAWCTGFLLLFHTLQAQAPKKYSSTDIYHSVQKLNFLGTALYVAAHPDDENTRLISYFSNELKARTAYLSLTRGDGGQNLIGPELQELLGVLRTQELLAARRADGGEQFFTRANDFGYSRNPKETLRIWDKEKVLSDVVWVIRNLKPDIIVNRFDHRTSGTTHGQHTSSALLSVEAFDLAGDEEKFSDQLDQTETWQPRRLFFNTSWWFYGSQENFAKADKSNMLELDTGVFYPLRGVSNNEIASEASSQHLCQGFGRLSTRGSQEEYIELIKGDLPEDTGQLFEGINTSWSRLTGGEAIGVILLSVENNFNFQDPSAHLPDLLNAHKLISALEDDHWRNIKIAEIETLITAVCGLYLEASSESASAYPGSTININIEAVNRSNAEILLKSVTMGENVTKEIEDLLENNAKTNLKVELSIPESARYTSHYWLSEPWTNGMYDVKDQRMIGKPETPSAYKAVFQLEINGYKLDLTRPVIHRYSRADKGELYQPFSILPKATANFTDKVIVFANSDSQEIPLTVTAHKDSLNGEVELKYPAGWSVENARQKIEINKKGDQKTLVFKVVPPAGENEGFISPVLRVNGREITQELVTISYDHIPTQSVLLESRAKVVRLNIERYGEHIGYIVGAGDKVPESLEQIGYKVHLIDPATIEAGSLNKFDAVVTGIRAYNVLETLKFKQKFLFDYVKEGGNLIIQYNTAGRWSPQYEDIAPYPLTLSRDRVTDENSVVEIIARDHPLINFPNPISESDFEGWVQERGLYFPGEWDAAFTPILSMQDEGETATEGSLLVAPYGEGHYIYTGLSFFRELPAGVPGAYKLFANMLSIGKARVENENAIKG
ncbi:MAG: PIG-L family deacetylase [Flavobacteriaceae bacterium]